MLFSSIPFLYYFLPCVLLLYFVAPKVLKNTVLLLSSLVFYAWGEPKYVFLMLATVLLGYVFGLLIERFRLKQCKAWSRLFMILSVTAFLGALAYFKYADFFIENFAKVTGISMPLLRLALPIGISFYTFQILSYTIDVYRGNVAAQKNPIHLAAYVALFPQLIAGPIVRYADVEVQLTERTHSFDKAAEGIRRFILGLSKKILIANVLGELCSDFLAGGDRAVLYYWLYALSFMLQIYFDFSGYSDMAIGLGKIFGFDFLENFNYPLIASSITDFWRRWHMSLGTWFRDYVYIPMGGNRVGKARFVFNIFTVWFLTGFWHGAAWNFIVWGLYFAVLLLVEKFFLLKYLQKSKVLRHVYVLFFVLISFAIFSANSMGEAIECVGGMFGFAKAPLVSAQGLYALRNYAGVLVIAVLGATPLPKKAVAWLQARKGTCKWISALEIPALLCLLLAATAFLVDGSFNPFLYFRF